MNDAHNSILIDEEDYNTLRDPINSFGRYDPMGLAKKLEKHPVLEFRRLAAHLYKVRMSAIVGRPNVRTNERAHKHTTERAHERTSEQMSE